MGPQTEWTKKQSSGDYPESDFPFYSEKIPVSYGNVEFQTLLNGLPGFSFCPYLAHKDARGWDLSTSRVYMNQVLPKFIYAPLDITKNDYASLRTFFSIAKATKSIIAVNITQPHKSSFILKKLFQSNPGAPINIDSLVKNEAGKLIPFNLNAPSFMGWFEEEVGNFDGATVLLIGVGGVGEPIARKIATSGAKSLILVDPNNKKQLTDELGQRTDIKYYRSLEAIPAENTPTSFTLINAAGKEGGSDPGLQALLENHKQERLIFVDLRPQLKIDIVEEAQKLGWQAYTGHGMNARNDYSLLTEIAARLDLTLPSFSQFKRIVAQAS